MTLRKKQYPTFKEWIRNEYHGPYMATDVIICYDAGAKTGIVLIERKHFPHGLALPGGIAEHIPLHVNAIKEAKEETGLEIILDSPLQPLCVLSEVNQDPREFIATAVYTGIGRGNLKPRPEEDAKSAEVYTLEEVHNLLKPEQSEKWAFPHHRKALSLYLHSLTQN